MKTKTKYKKKKEKMRKKFIIHEPGESVKYKNYLFRFSFGYIKLVLEAYQITYVVYHLNVPEVGKYDLIILILYTRRASHTT